ASASAMICSSSSADLRPCDGSPPEPSPRVVCAPIWSRVGASDWLSAWTSVLALMNSTPRSPAPIMRFTALPPAPPQPITLSLAVDVLSISSSNPCTSLCRPQERLVEQLLEPAAGIERVAPVAVGPPLRGDRFAALAVRRVEHQPHAGRKARIGDMFRQAAQ